MKKYITTSIMIASIGLWIYQGLFLNEEEIILPEAMHYQDFIEDKDRDFMEPVLAEEDVATSTEEILTDELSQTYEIDDVVVDLAQVDIVEEKVLGDKIKNNSINLAVPFTSQAPTADWSLPWNDACEEASIMMVDYYYQGSDFPRPSIVQDILFDMVEWQEENWQGHFNLPIVELAKYVEKNYSYDYEIVDNLTIDKIKYYLDRGLPVIVPANGKKLEQPYFSNGGPEYHMLVIKGYLDDEKKFISNDPGTWRGENFIYSYDNMIDSIADWDKKRSSATGSKRALILYKN